MIAAMSGLGLKGMAPTPCGAPHGDPGTGAFDEAVTTGVQRKRTVSEILTDSARRPRSLIATPPRSATA
jgi:hypothetical protein